jgi:serine/threonine-protein kinase
LIRVERGELAAAVAGAVLRPVTSEWDAVTPATRRLELALGADLADQVRATGELPVGAALVTPAGALEFELAVHVAVRSLTEAVTAAGVVRGLRAGLLRLQEWGVRSVALPPLGTGAGNLEIEESADLSIPVLLDHMASHEFPEEVLIVVESEYEQDVFERRLHQARAAHAAGTIGSR